MNRTLNHASNMILMDLYKEEINEAIKKLQNWMDEQFRKKLTDSEQNRVTSLFSLIGKNFSL